MEKKAFFTSNTIDRKSRQMLERISTLGLSHSNIKFNPKKAALLVLDMQKYFFSIDSHAFIPSAPTIISNVLTLIEAFTVYKQPIYFSRHSNNYETAGMMAVWWKEVLDLNSEMSPLINEIDSTKGTIIHKERYDAFWKTSLGKLLQQDSIEQVVICGVMTHLCCETTARSAFIQDYQVFFTVDGTATYSERLHMASLLTLSHGFAKPVLCQDIAAA
jgi:isochorismate hydrolase